MARPLFAAHLAYRRESDAASTDPYFAHPRDPANKPATEILHAPGPKLISATVVWREQTWLAERGQRLVRTGPGQDQGITPPRPIVPARPRWISDGPA